MAIGDSEETLGLLAQAQGGHQVAVEQLLALHRAGITAFVSRRLSPQVQSRLDASDVVQDAFREAIRRLDDFLSLRPMPFRLWLRRIAYDHLMMQHRRHLGLRRRNHRVELMISSESSELMAKWFASDKSTPTKQALRREKVAVVQAALQALDGQDREILMMRTLDALAYEDIAAIFGLSVVAVRQRYSRALSRLAKTLNAAGWRDGK